MRQKRDSAARQGRVFQRVRVPGNVFRKADERLAELRWKTERTRALHECWARIAQRRGKAVAAVALARKLAGILFAIWRDGTEFDVRLLRTTDAAAVPWPMA